LKEFAMRIGIRRLGSEVQSPRCKIAELAVRARLGVAEK
jgi:hypothetical protein